MTPSEILLLRTRLKWTQAKLAAETGYHLRTIIRWESGDVSPSPVAIKMLERLLEGKGKA